MKEIKADVIKTVLGDASRQRSSLKGLVIFGISGALYAISMAGVSVSHTTAFMTAWAVLAGGCIGLLFIIGHDACHGALTPNRKLNSLIGRLAFLPSLTPFLAWELGHNRLHHGWTNFRGKDYVWRPYSKEEFDTLSIYRRLLERVYRSIPGVCLYGIIEIWWKHMIWPRRSDLQKMDRKLFELDRVLVIGFLIFEIIVLYVGNRLTSNETSSLLLLTEGIVIPIVVWNWMFGFLIFLHHTHPSVQWYDKEEEWSFFRGQVEGTVHIVFPSLIGLILHNIMEHTAHHIDPRIPLYNLRSSQLKLEDSFVGIAIVQKWSLHHFIDTLARCQLYDYTNKCWLSFRGSASTPI